MLHGKTVTSFCFVLFFDVTNGLSKTPSFSHFLTPVKLSIRGD